MTHGRTKKTKASLAGWWKGLPLLILPFTVFFAEAHFKTVILRNHYQAGKLAEEVQNIEARIEILRDERSHLTRFSQLEKAAPDLGLVEPEPGQVIILRADASLFEETYLVAREASDGGAEGSEAGAAPLSGE